MKSGVQGGATERGAAGAMKLFVQIFFFKAAVWRRRGWLFTGWYYGDRGIANGGGSRCGWRDGDGNRSNGVAFVADFTYGGGGNGGFKFKDMMLVLSSLFIVLFKTKIVVFNGTSDY